MFEVIVVVQTRLVHPDGREVRSHFLAQTLKRGIVGKTVLLFVAIDVGERAQE